MILTILLSFAQGSGTNQLLYAITELPVSVLWAKLCTQTVKHVVSSL